MVIRQEQPTTQSTVCDTTDHKTVGIGVGDATGAKIVAVILGELGVVERRHGVHMVRIVHPLLGHRVIVRDTSQRSEFPDGSTTVAVVFEFGEEVDAVAA
jgi:hypothetical protein